MSGISCQSRGNKTINSLIGIFGENLLVSPGKQIQIDTPRAAFRIRKPIGVKKSLAKGDLGVERPRVDKCDKLKCLLVHTLSLITFS